MTSTVLIVGGDRLIEAMFVEREWEVVRFLTDEPDLVVFTGGADVSPHLYEEPNFASYTNKQRDEFERLVYRDATELDLKMAGICRGAQFLNVMNGGRMYQDVDSHAIGGTHSLVDVDTGEEVQVTSTHHQMMRPNFPDAKLVALANLGGEKRYWDDSIKSITDETDYEVLWYENSKSLCFQGHPEYGVKSTTDYFFSLLGRYHGFEDIRQSS